MKRSLVFPLLFLLSLASCDDSSDVFEKWNKTPVITIYKDGFSFLESRDTLKIGYPVLYTFSVTDEESISVSLNSTPSLIASINNDIKTFSVDANSPGLHNLSISAYDSFNSSSTLEILFFCFSNWTPVPKLSLTSVQGLEVLIDAKSSFDPDLKFGGGIIKYEYTINNITYQSTKNQIFYIYGSSGTKTVKLRVQDNDLAWSDWITEYITI